MSRFALVALLAVATCMPVAAQVSEANSPISAGWLFGYQQTNRGWGASFSYLTGRDVLQWSGNLDIHLVKDLRETRRESVFGPRGRPYVFGKLNHLFVLSPSVGFVRNVVKVGNGGLLNVRLGGKVGPAIGLLNPYYLEIFSPIGGNTNVGEAVVQAYDPSEHSYQNIVGRAGALSSPFNPKVQVGASSKIFALIDLSQDSKKVNAVQVGLHADWFPSPVPIMADFVETAGNQFFLAFSLGFTLGNRW